MKLKVNDLVQVITGKDKGKTGKITKVMPKSNKVIVENVNKYKRHLKKRGNNPSSVVEIERSIDVCKVMLTVGDKPSRVGYKVDATGNKVRIAKKTNEPVDKK